MKFEHLSSSFNNNKKLYTKKSYFTFEIKSITFLNFNLQNILYFKFNSEEPLTSSIFNDSKNSILIFFLIFFIFFIFTFFIFIFFINQNYPSFDNNTLHFLFINDNFNLNKNFKHFNFFINTILINFIQTLELI